MYVLLYFQIGLTIIELILAIPLVMIIFNFGCQFIQNLDTKRSHDLASEGRHEVRRSSVISPSVIRRFSKISRRNTETMI